ncbi:hypothetical protein ACRAR1_06940 [Streptomyces sanyensis]|uniref:hypothetical protein n=1 Tax=Streptomyces sanyensis TaxID=568869 RepID=UPI003D78512D
MPDRTTTAKPRRARASASQQKWNRGKVGAPTPPAVRTTGRDCADPACGTTGPRPAPASVRVEVPGSREPVRWYCPGPCASYGHALAEVRAIGGSRA